MKGFAFEKFLPKPQKAAGFDQLLDMFNELLMRTGGDVAEAMQWLTNLDRRYQFTDPSYGIGDFYRDLLEKGIVVENPGSGEAVPSQAAGQNIRRKAFDDLFGKIKKSKSGDHNTFQSGNQGETSPNLRAYSYGDGLEQISLTQTLYNAYINHGVEGLTLQESDLEVFENESFAQTATVLMIDISHSMILYGEDRITPAKKVAMALSEMITTRYKKDTLDIVVFGDDAWPVEIKDLPFLQVGPYHTNTAAGLELAVTLLRRRKCPNKQIFMITDGKPTCIKQGLKYYKNSFGHDPLILNKTFNLAAQCRRLDIPITTFMIASDSYLREFVAEFTLINNGRAFYSNLDKLGDLVFEDYRKNRKRN
jgi:uncharacterized protein with von Willebrand factor type A (vWA) domain